MRILVVDDEQDICEILQYNLETEGYEVDVAYSAESALDMIADSVKSDSNTEKRPSYSLILLDIMMGEMSGFQMARKLKENRQTADIPIIFITALDDEDCMVKGLNIGGDDYISKPLSMKEVKARVKAVLRRVRKDSPKGLSDANRQNASETVTRYKTLCLDSSSKTVTLDNEPIQLTKLEFELLQLLLKNPNKVFSRNELLDRCWPSDTYVLDRTVDVNITRLRKKIGKYGKQIKTRFGYGYVFEV